MCGFLGIVWSDESRLVDNEWLMRITNEMKHRGPDDSGFFIDGNVGLGHRRLSIIDLSGGRQPVFNEDRTVVTVYNGEIYNYKQVREELKRKGHVFHSDCDTEVIVHAYEEYKEDCSGYMAGMFGFLVYDNKAKKIYVSRDRIGIKPVYYYQDKDVFIVSSEIKSILSTGLVKAEVCLGSIEFYLSTGYVPGPQTIFKNIHKLNPGHYLTFSRGKLEIRRYWNLANVGCFTGSFEDASERLTTLLDECVGSHLMSDVPLGVFLSGGLDSSAMVGIASRLSRGRVKTFSVGYKEDEVSELGYARIVADTFHCEHHEFVLSPENFLESISQVLRFTEEPINESAAVPLFRLSKLAREHATVLLSGEGADEVFAGYPIYRIMKWVRLLRSAGKFMPGRLVLDVSRSCGFTEKMNKYIHWIFSREDAAYKSVSGDMTADYREKLMSRDLIAAGNGSVQGYFLAKLEEVDHWSDLRKMQYVDLTSWLPDDLLVKADKVTMAASVELRVPFLDHRMIEFGVSLPDAFKLRNSTGKYILKNVMRDILPKEIVHRKKRGFPVPISKWFANDIFQQTSEILNDPKTLQRGYYNKKYIDNLLKSHKDGKENFSKAIFAILNLELWHRQYIDKTVSNLDY